MNANNYYYNSWFILSHGVEDVRLYEKGQWISVSCVVLENTRVNNNIFRKECSPSFRCGKINEASSN